MKTITVFDKPMCCSSGVCGPSVDPALARFADDLRWLAGQGIQVQRHNPAHDATAFMHDPIIREAMKAGGEAVLPVIVVDGEERSRQRYPERDELAGWVGLPIATDPATSTKGGCCGTSGCC